jgi:hypothetical protein
MAEVSDEYFAELRETVLQLNLQDLPSLLQFMQKCVKCEYGNEDSHVMADLLMIQLLSELAPKEGLVKQIIVSYMEGMEGHWWFA